jgi:hypothetical protein
MLDCVQMTEDELELTYDDVLWPNMLYMNGPRHLGAGRVPVPSQLARDVGTQRHHASRAPRTSGLCQGVRIITSSPSHKTLYGIKTVSLL